MANTMPTPRAVLRPVPERDGPDNDGTPMIAYIADAGFPPVLDPGDIVWCGPATADWQELKRLVVKFKGESLPTFRITPSRGIAGCGLEISEADAARVEWVAPIRWVRRA